MMSPKTLEAFNEMTASYLALNDLAFDSPKMFSAAKVLFVDCEWLVRCMREDDKERARLAEIKELTEGDTEELTESDDICPQCGSNDTTHEHSGRVCNFCLHEW